MSFAHASLPDFLLDESRSGDYYINLDEYRTNLLSLFLERPCSIPDPYSFANNLKHEPGIEFGECTRLLAISILLREAKASRRLQRACMNFNFIMYGTRMVNDCSINIDKILNCLKKLVCLNTVYMRNPLVDTIL
jgi:hypothetical protein